MVMQTDIGYLEMEFRKMMKSAGIPVEKIHPEQVTDMRRAFFGGALICLRSTEQQRDCIDLELRAYLEARCP